MTGPLPTPAGWYPDPSGAPGLRYWDGARWTAVAPAPPPVAYQPLAAKRSSFPSWVIVAGIIAIVGALYAYGAHINSEEKKSSSGISSTYSSTPTTPEDKYFDWLQKYDFNVTSDNRATLLTAGHSICTDLRNGVDPDREARTIYRAVPEATDKKAGLLVTAAQMGLCPDTM